MSIAVSDVIVIVAAVAPVGFLWWFFFGPKTARRAHLVGGVQEVDVTVKGGYSPSVIRVTEGVPLRSRFDRQESGDCTSRVVFADFGASKTLPAFGTAILEFTPDKAGEFDFACGMNMIHGTLVVGRADGSTTEGDAGGREVASAVGVGPSTEATVVTERVEFGVSNMSCASCVVNIESVIGELAGVDNVEVSFGTERATVDFDPSQIAATEIQAAAGNAGYRLTPRTRRERPTPKTLKPPSAAPRSRTCPGGWCSVRPLPLRWWWSWRWTCSALGWVPEFMVNPWFSNASRCYTASHAGNGRSGRVLSDFARGADEHHAAKTLFDSPGPA